MDDDDFDDLLAGTELLEGSSQESLTYAAAHLNFDDPEHEVHANTAVESLPTINARTDGIFAYNANLQPSREFEVPLSPPNRSYGTEDRRHSSPPLEATSKTAVMIKIEAIFNNISDALLQEERQLTITIKTRPKPPISVNSAIQNDIADSTSTNTRQISFPGKTAGEAWRFTVVMRILELVHEALRDDVVLSKRDIYYRDPALFGNQATVDRYVDQIALTFGAPRSLLNVTAVAKGLVAGAVRFRRRDGSDVNATSDREGILVPSLRDVLSVEMVSVRWLLVIEKEATFRSIAASTFWDVVSTQGVIMTGKGYPDIATRALLHFLSTPSPLNGFSSPPAYGLVDCDPDGLAILSVYKYGSQTLCHEDEDLRVPQLKWLGLRLEHMMLGGHDIHASQGLLPLTTRDRTKAFKMLERCASSEDEGDDFQLRQALQTMVMLNTKAELQLLDATPDGMTRLLASELSNL